MKWNLDNPQADIEAVRESLAEAKPGTDAHAALRRMERDILAVIDGSWKPTAERYEEILDSHNFQACCANANGGDLVDSDDWTPDESAQLERIEQGPPPPEPRR